jgi:hypothetical protein
MLIVKGIDHPKDVKLIKHFTRYCLSQFLTPYRIGQLVIEIRYLDRASVEPADAADLAKYEAWMNPTDDKNRFYVTIAKFAINSRAKSPLSRYKKTLHYLAHELVHVKQYVTGQLKNLYHGEELIGAVFNGVEYLEPTGAKAANPITAEWAYYNYPYEIEAYGRAEGLYNMFHEEHATKWMIKY